MLTQEEFNYIIALKKEFKENNQITLESKWSRDIVAIETRDMFILDYYIGTIALTKFTYNKRYRKTIAILRFDSSGRHTNPDGQVFDGPHVHIYRENYGDKFAFYVSEIGINTDAIEKINVLENFLKYCNVINYPEIQQALF